METWRLIKQEAVDDSYAKMATDEAILNSVSKGQSPTTLRFYKWNKPAVAIGYFQSVEEEVDVVTCKQDNVEIFRRMTGGGAVYKDPEGELNYSLIIKESHPLVPQDILRSYQVIQQGVIEGLALLGLKAEMAGINDILIEGKKISGNAQTRKSGVVLQHGTILLDFYVEKMIRYLKIPQEKISDKNIKNIRDRVGTLKQYLPKASFFEVERAVTLGLGSVFNSNFELGELTEKEKEDKEELRINKYSTQEWNYWR